MFTLALNISPLDGDKLPSVSMIETVGEGYVIRMERADFWACVSHSISYLRERAYQARQKARLARKRAADAERKRR